MVVERLGVILGLLCELYPALWTQAHVLQLSTVGAEYFPRNADAANQLRADQDRKIPAPSPLAPCLIRFRTMNPDLRPPGPTRDRSRANHRH